MTEHLLERNIQLDIMESNDDKKILFGSEAKYLRHPNAALVLPSIGRRFMGSNQVFPTFRWLLNDSGILEIGCSRSIKGQLPAFYIAAAIATWILGYGSPVISFRIVGHICVNSGQTHHQLKKNQTKT